MLNRKLTNFPSELTKKLYSLYKSSDNKDTLKYYQILVAEYLKLNVSKGLYLYHHMGLGKTVASYHIMLEMMQQDENIKALVIAPKSLIDNFKNSANKYTELTGNKIDLNRLNFVRFSSTTEKQIVKADESKNTNPLSFDESKGKVTRLKNLDNYIVFIEEAHMFARKLVNGSDSTIRIYDILMKSKCRIVMLSGSFIASSPFEMAPIFNLLSGEVLLPEIKDDFEKYFIDVENNTITNTFALQNRIYGLVSRMKTEYLSSTDKNLFPTQLETQIIKAPMKEDQLEAYAGYRIIEMRKESEKKGSVFKSKNVNKFKSSGSNMGSYRIRSRQACNAYITRKIEELYKKPNYNQKEIIDEVFNMSIDELSISKIKEAHKIIKSRNKQKGVIYSQFIGIGGASSIAAYLYKNGWDELGPDLKLINHKIKEERKPNNNRFARINGSLNIKEQSDILEYFNSKDNIYGENLRLIIIGLEQTMGIDLNCVRYEIMFEPYWVYFIFDQFNYRMNRLGSHLLLPKDKQNCQMYIMLSSLPKGRTISDGQKTEIITTDEHIYNRMMENGDIINSCKKVVEEVSIECELVMMMGAKKHNCKVCAPTGELLYTTDNKDNPNLAIQHDINASNPCNENKKEEVEAEEIKIKLNGETTTYYKIPNKDNIYGFSLYFEKDGEYIEVPIESPIYKTIKK